MNLCKDNNPEGIIAIIEATLLWHVYTKKKSGRYGWKEPWLCLLSMQPSKLSPIAVVTPSGQQPYSDISQSSMTSVGLTIDAKLKNWKKAWLLKGIFRWKTTWNLYHTASWKPDSVSTCCKDEPISNNRCYLCRPAIPIVRNCRAQKICPPFPLCHPFDTVPENKVGPVTNKVETYG